MSFSREVSRINGNWPSLDVSSKVFGRYGPSSNNRHPSSFSICTLVKLSRPMDAWTFHTQSHLMKKGNEQHRLETRSSKNAHDADAFPSSCRWHFSPSQQNTFGLTRNFSSFLWHVSGTEWAYAIPQAQAQSSLSSWKETTTPNLHESANRHQKWQLPGKITFACAYVIWPRQQANLMFTIFPPAISKLAFKKR